MSFFDLFKRKEKDQENEIVGFSEIGLWLEKKEVGVKNKRKSFLDILKKRIAQLVVELTEELHILNEINFDKKKERERIKAIVKENYNNYMIHLERLISKLNDIHDDKNIIEGLNSIFSDFQKRSSVNYEKATYLIGKEMGDVKESIKIFFKDIGTIVNNHSDLMNESNIIEEIRKVLINYNNLNQNKIEFKKQIEEKKEENVSVNELSKKKEEEIEILKNSEKFICEIKKRDELENRKKELKKEIQNLSSIIEFKALANYYHRFEKQMTIVKGYKNDFRWHFEKSKGKDLILLLKEAKLYTEKISNNILKIERLREKISEIKIENTGLNTIEEELKNLNFKKEEVEKDISDNKKRLIKMEETISEEKKKMQSVLSKMDVTLK